MKKTFFTLFILLISSVSFAEEYTKNEMAERFFSTSNTYVKYINNEKDIYYVPRNLVTSIEIGEKKITFRWENKDAIGTDEYTESYSYEKWNITGDENGNITISRKKK